MALYYKVPMVIDAIRLTSGDVEGTVTNLVEYLKAGAGGWNHLRAAGFMRKAFDGASDLSGLVSACKGDGRKAFLDNAKILEAALPKIIGRRAQSFSFPRTKFIISPTIMSAVGPAFFIVEGGTIKLIYVHARNEGRASLANLASFAELAKREILDNDFYAQPGDIEVHYVDKRQGNRTDQVLSLGDLAKHAEEPIDSILGRFAEAFRIVDTERLAGPKAIRRRKAPEMGSEQSTFDF